MDPVQTLSNIVGINSIFPNESSIALYLETRLKQLGFLTRRIYVSQNRFNVVAQRGTIGQPILFYAHMDTVPVYGKWDYDPFTLRQDGDRLYGLGAYDMKAGITAILHAVDITTDQKIKIAFAVDEENDSVGAFAILKDGFFNDCKVAIVPEINDSEILVSIPNAIMLSRRGRAVYSFDVHGISAHGAHIKDGVNAITQASKLAIELENTNNSFLPNESGVVQSQFVRKIYGENTSLSLADLAHVELDRHITLPNDSKSTLCELESKVSQLYKDGILDSSAPKCSVFIKPRANPYLEPYQTSQNDSSVVLLSKIVEQNVAKPVYTCGLSTADECVIALASIPVISYGPVGANPHKPNEWVSQSSLRTVALVLKKFIEMQ